MSHSTPIDPFLEKQGLMILDGGLATELEARGLDLNTPLWSARVLKTRPEVIGAVHLDYLEAGADCIITASYQASIDGFLRIGQSAKEARAAIQLSVDLATEARERYIKKRAGSVHERTRLNPLVAGSVGPYGAFTADGGEYRGDYDVPDEHLRSFHEPRWQILNESAADFLACETIPSFQEARVLLDMLKLTPGCFAWFSFSCKDGEHISDGTPIRECAGLLADCSQVLAIGVNCTPPEHISSLIKNIRGGAPNKPVAVYPNSGEVYDAVTKTWKGTSDPQNCALAAREWLEAGAGLIGGCCRTGPAHIKAIRDALTR